MLPSFRVWKINRQNVKLKVEDLASKNDVFNNSSELTEYYIIFDRYNGIDEVQSIDQCKFEILSQ